jgi:hypothetical protein
MSKPKKPREPQPIVGSGNGGVSRRELRNALDFAVGVARQVESKLDTAAVRIESVEERLKTMDEAIRGDSTGSPSILSRLSQHEFRIGALDAVVKEQNEREVARDRTMAAMRGKVLLSVITTVLSIVAAALVAAFRIKGG